MFGFLKGNGYSLSCRFPKVSPSYLSPAHNFVAKQIPYRREEETINHGFNSPIMPRHPLALVAPPPA